MHSLNAKSQVFFISYQFILDEHQKLNVEQKFKFKYYVRCDQIHNNHSYYFG